MCTLSTAAEAKLRRGGYRAAKRATRRQECRDSIVTFMCTVNSLLEASLKNVAHVRELSEVEKRSFSDDGAVLRR